MPAKHKKRLDYGVGPVGMNFIPAVHTSCVGHPQAQAISAGIASSSGHPGPVNSSGSASGRARATGATDGQ